MWVTGNRTGLTPPLKDGGPEGEGKVGFHFGHVERGALWNFQLAVLERYRFGSHPFGDGSLNKPQSKSQVRREGSATRAKVRARGGGGVPARRVGKGGGGARAGQSGGEKGKEKVPGQRAEEGETGGVQLCPEVRWSKTEKELVDLETWPSVTFSPAVWECWCQNRTQR